MAYLIGTDEAGYGPNLGPLTVGASLWRVPDHLIQSGRCDLFHQLHSVVRPIGKGNRSPRGSGKPSDKKFGLADRLPIGDSKALFTSRGCLAVLEKSVLSMLVACRQPIGDFYELVDSVAGLSAIQLAEETTYDWSSEKFPKEVERSDIDDCGNAIRICFDRTQVQCLKIASAILFPGDFNQGLKDFGNKANLLSTVTCRLVNRLRQIAEEDFRLGQQAGIFGEKGVVAGDSSSESIRLLIQCDKHGGRAHYAGLLQQEMTESFVQVVAESREQSTYRWTDEKGDTEMQFIAKGESELPIALASMIAKYLRELSMESWNRFWKRKVPDLMPTAGYPQDAKRFIKEIGTAQEKLKVGDHLIWRNK